MDGVIIRMSIGLALSTVEHLRSSDGAERAAAETFEQKRVASRGSPGRRTPSPILYVRRII
jgi:hypothetical protein